MAKHGIAAIAQGRTDLFRMDPKQITIRHGWNSRDFDLEENIQHVDQLAESIREVGVKEPLSGYLEDDTFVLTNGESRLRAVLKLLSEGVEIKTVPVQPEPRYASEADHLASQIIRNSGKPFTPMENAKTFSRLLDLGWTVAEIAKKTGITTERVHQIARLNAVTETVRKHVQRGEITPTLVQRIQAKAKNAGEVEEQVVDAIKTAQADGKKKATPRHHARKDAKPKAPAARTNYRDLFEELMSYVTSTEEESSDTTTEVVASIPKDRWEAMNTVCSKKGGF